MYVTSLEIENLRCFEKAELSLLYPGMKGLPKGVLDNVNLLVGVNGAGKTTILKAVALVVLTPVLESSGFVPYYLVRRPKGTRSLPLIRNWEESIPTATITARTLATMSVSQAMSDENQYISFVQIGQHPDRERIRVVGRPKHEYDSLGEMAPQSRFLAGYGATRRVEMAESVDAQSRKRRLPQYQRVAGLFEDYIALLPLGAWLPHLKNGKAARYKEIVSLINAVLPHETRFEGKFEDLDAVFLHEGIHLPFGALSDGYRAYIGLICDLIYHLQTVCPVRRKLTKLSGIVLIDDLDLQLHPRWQRVVVPTLAKHFPLLQFVITTHSPIVAGSVHSQNVRIIQSEGDFSTVETSTERLHGLNADQIAISPYFGLPTTRAEDAVEKLKTLSAQTQERGDPALAIQYLNELAGTTPENE
jgi:predicted ATP-binding protein involved in virulence